MANVFGSGFMKWDTLTGAASPFTNTKVTKIIVKNASGDAADVLSLQRGATPAVFDPFPMSGLDAGDFYQIDYPGGQWMHNLSAVTLDAGMEVTVEYE